jgi:hypothetical protein
MAQIKQLARFLAVQSGDGARLTIETEGGGSFEVEATFEQLELIADTLDEILSVNDDATEVRDAESA